MKNITCTSIEQSKKLIELGIDEDTSDMVYLRSYFEDEGKYNLLVGSYREGYAEKDDGTLVPVFDEHIPAWSLAALLNILKEPELIRNSEGKWLIRVWHTKFPYSIGGYNNSVDACVEMIIKLYELKML